MLVFKWAMAVLPFASLSIINLMISPFPLQDVDSSLGQLASSNAWIGLPTRIHDSCITIIITYHLASCRIFPRSNQNLGLAVASHAL